VHVIVGQAEMMADLVDRHVTDEVVEPHAGFHPFGQDRLAIEVDGIRHRAGIHR
jgi:hypothetical protein